MHQPLSTLYKTPHAKIETTIADMQKSVEQLPVSAVQDHKTSVKINITKDHVTENNDANHSIDEIQNDNCINDTLGTIQVKQSNTIDTHMNQNLHVTNETAENDILTQSTSKNIDEPTEEAIDSAKNEFNGKVVQQAHMRLFGQSIDDEDIKHRVANIKPKVRPGRHDEQPHHEQSTNVVSVSEKKPIKKKRVQFGPDMIREVTKIQYPWNLEESSESDEDDDDYDDYESYEDDESDEDTHEKEHNEENIHGDDDIDNTILPVFQEVLIAEETLGNEDI